MNKINASFQKISYKQFVSDFSFLGEEKLRSTYDSLKIPRRGTSNSAGYDLFSPFSFSLEANSEILIPTGIKCYIPNGCFLLIAPRSGLGSKNRFQLNNTVGIIDSDYFFSDNEGHIMLKMINDSRNGETLFVEQGKGIAQAILLKYYITNSDNSHNVRNGGFGSTDGSII